MQYNFLKRIQTFGFCGLLLAIFSSGDDQHSHGKKQEEHRKPNIIILYADDLGYGDLGAYGATQVKTPNIDYLADNGIQFTDAHSSSATCTPSRYSLLTGNYAFRRNVQVLPGDASLLIKPETPTLPKTLKQYDYKTAVIGKWHLGIGDGDIDWNETVAPGPNDVGFDYSFVLPSTGDRVPSVYMENNKVVGLEENDSLNISFVNDPRAKNPFERPTGLSNPELLKQKADIQHSGSIVNGISRIGFMGGGKNAEIVDEDLTDMLLEKTMGFIEKNKDSSFFLYLPFHDIHVPRVPHSRFIGKSTMGPRGDAIVQMDWMTGQITAHLKSLKIERNTMILFTSDNGAVLNDGYEDKAEELLGKHKPNGPFNGGKYSAFEGGTRVPTIVYWPGTVEKGKSSALIGQVDMYKSLISLINGTDNHKIPPDGQNVLPALLGKTKKGRDHLLEESYTFSIRQGNWKYIAPSQKDYSWVDIDKNIASGIKTIPQLYHLETDLTESKNLAEENPEKVRELKSLLDNIVKSNE